ncbi:Transposase InsO and inactivated derivatives [Tenacibaculum sp. MAR_2009_124]|uniref:IS3 family transposase n=1 Tax=Tenacibaculum sp. MAR_2009_124 TaxID=1250059 RepID=UPI00089CDA81|nr:IS3 family transposase [Tenacibaculum sp. MAR_2009_124]SEB49771.1 Transposase InsO and inactivated derivatives [Tenacibaculum sp. MAR_2009_124]
MTYSLNKLYKTIGISKQSVYQYQKRQEVFEDKLLQLITEADVLRKEHPGCGVEKMYYSLAPDFIGRDRFIEIMMKLGYRLKRKKNYKRTTIASKIYYPNLIKGITVSAPNIIWQSDITYILVDGKFYYAVFIIDVYSKEIVGYSIADHIRATANVKALRMALKIHGPPRFHHSDRGSQYIYKEYIQILKANNIQISMATSAQDNAYAERINRTIKEEYLDHWKPKNFFQLKQMTKKAIKNYNEKRIHNSIDRKRPSMFRANFSLLTSQQRKSITIFNNEVLT